MIDIPLILVISTGVSVGGAFSSDIVQMVMHAGPMVKFVMLILGIFSVVSWAIILAKLRLVRRARQETEEFLELFWETGDWKRVYIASKDLDYSPVAHLFVTGYAEFNKLRRMLSSPNPSRGQDHPDSPGPRQATMDNLGRSMNKGTIDQLNRLERALSFLATTGNTAPFIGLFGTVWGIMESFRGIGLKGSASLAVVAPGISEALVATAAGLAAAIPAVVAFNHFNHKISSLRAEMEIFASDFLSMVERQFYRNRMVTRNDQ